MYLLLSAAPILYADMEISQAIKNSSKNKKNYTPTTTLKGIEIPVRYEVKRSSAGLGLYATEKIKKGETIIEYVGNIIDDEQASKKSKCMYIFEVKKNVNIDGSPRWNIARYANYSCDPNAESENNRGRIYIVATKNISVGGEITFDYGEEHVNEHIKPHGCLCGTKKCKLRKSRM